MLSLRLLFSYLYISMHYQLPGCYCTNIHTHSSLEKNCPLLLTNGLNFRSTSGLTSTFALSDNSLVHIRQ